MLIYKFSEIIHRKVKVKHQIHKLSPFHGDDDDYGSVIYIIFSFSTLVRLLIFHASLISFGTLPIRLLIGSICHSGQVSIAPCPWYLIPRDLIAGWARDYLSQLLLVCPSSRPGGLRAIRSFCLKHWVYQSTFSSYLTSCVTYFIGCSLIWIFQPQCPIKP